MASPVLLSLLLFMPETSAPNILLRRARRLRELTGDSRLQSQSEIDQRSLSACDILFSALLRPMEIMFKDPPIFFVHVYTGYFYGDFYTFFEVFTLVFLPFYGFNLGQTGLAFLSCMIGVMVAILGYFAYLYFYMVPDNLKERPPRARTSSCPGHCWLVPAANWTIPFRMDVRLQDTLVSSFGWRGHLLHRTLLDHAVHLHLHPLLVPTVCGLPICGKQRDEIGDRLCQCHICAIPLHQLGGAQGRERSGRPECDGDFWNDGHLHLWKAASSSVQVCTKLDYSNGLNWFHLLFEPPLGCL